MTSSGSSSSSARALASLAALLLAAAAPADPPTAAPSSEPAAAGPSGPAAPAPPPPTAGADWRFTAERDVAPPASLQVGPDAAPRRLALFPVQNLTGGAAPVREITAALREQLVRRGLELAPEEGVHRLLAARRVRYTGGLERATAAALRAELGVEGVIISSLEAFGPATPFRFALTTRLVATGGEPVITWLDTFAHTGDDSPGLLGRHVAAGVAELRDRALEQAAASLASARWPPRPGAPCPDHRGRAPRRSFRSPLLADGERRSIAVLPFANTTGRRDAGEVVALRVMAALAGAGTARVVEPGVVRAEMLSYRLGATGGISLDDARVILRALDADLVLAGTVRTFEEAGGARGAPDVDFSAWVLDRETARLVWSSTSSATGEDGVFFFGAGRIATASGLACALAKGAVGVMLKGRAPPDPRAAPPDVHPRPPEVAPEEHRETAPEPPTVPPREPPTVPAAAPAPEPPPG